MMPGHGERFVNVTISTVAWFLCASQRIDLVVEEQIQSYQFLVLPTKEGIRKKRKKILLPIMLF